MVAHLRAYSGYSARFSASLPDVLAERAAERGLDTVALTDRDTVAGAVRFTKACARVGVRPLFGIDLAVLDYLDAGTSSVRERRRSPVRGGAFIDESAPGVRFLARNRAGWAALCRLITAAWPLDELAQLRRDGGLDAVAARLTSRPLPATEPDADDPVDEDTAAPADHEQPAARQLGRRVRLETGYELNAWADRSGWVPGNSEREPRQPACSWRP
jgi:error-prone DNA polymerase